MNVFVYVPANGAGAPQKTPSQSSSKELQIWFEQYTCSFQLACTSTREKMQTKWKEVDAPAKKINDIFPVTVIISLVEIVGICKGMQKCVGVTIVLAFSFGKKPVRIECVHENSNSASSAVRHFVK